MKKIIALLCFVLFTAIKSNAQLYYTFETTTTIFNEITDGDVPTLSDNGTDPLGDEGYVAHIPIGFNFTFNRSQIVNEVGISTNGFISLGNLTNAYVDNFLNDGASSARPIIAPLWDDLNIGSTMNLTYKTIGTAPNRTFVVQWLNTRWGLGSTSASISFQLLLSETTNFIQFIYRQESGIPVNPSASVGLCGSAIGVNNFISLSDLSNAATTSSITETRNISTKPNTNQSFIFKPLLAAPLTIVNINATKERNVNKIEWQTVNEINCAGFHLQRSINGTDFSSIATQKTKAITGISSASLWYNIIDDKPHDGVNYYRLKQIDNDGKVFYSKIVSVKNTSNNWATLNLFPNPVIDYLNIQIFANSIADINIEVLNSNAQKLVQAKQNIKAENNTIQIPVSQLPKGLYTLKVINVKTGETLIKQFAK